MTRDGGPAFPSGRDCPPEDEATLRDWFAGQALAARTRWDTVHPMEYASIACECYAMADAMIAGRAEDGAGEVSDEEVKDRG